MFRRETRLRAPALLIAALAAILVFAATASAETRTGESTSTVSLAPSAPEATLLKGTTSYDTAGGNMVFNVTTAAPPQSENDPASDALIVGLTTTSGECNSTIPAIQSIAYSGSAGVYILTSYEEPSAETVSGNLLSIVDGGGGVVPLGPATKTISGSTTTLSASSSSLVEQTYNCAVVFMEGESSQSFMAFPVKAAPVPPAPPAPPAPAPAPPALSIAKTKPLTLKVGKSKTVKVKVTNTGATATAQGSLRVKAAKGVVVKPEVQKLPVLAPGASWSVSVKVQLTKKAKKSSTLSLIGTASGLTGTGSLVVKLKQ
jgi:hypothetical protein